MLRFPLHMLFQGNLMRFEYARKGFDNPYPGVLYFNINSKFYWKLVAIYECSAVG